MNRTCNFRVFCEKHNRWEYYTLGGLICGDTTSFNGEGGIFNHKTWGQYIGASDKNNKQIFEDDILQNLDGYNFKVEFYTCGFMAKCIKEIEGSLNLRYLLHDNYYMSRYFLIGEGCQVIGNIHDNPELL